MTLPLDSGLCRAILESLPAALYVVNRDFRTPPSQLAGQTVFPKGQEEQAMALMKAQAAADSYLLRGVYLCGAAAVEPRCRR